jgi:hypothetical protein
MSVEYKVGMMRAGYIIMTIILVPCLILSTGSMTVWLPILGLALVILSIVATIAACDHQDVEALELALSGICALEISASAVTILSLIAVGITS